LTESDTKIHLIKEYFKDIEERIEYLDKLVDDNHQDEAFLLCSVYIESLANRYYQEYGSSKGFCYALIELTDNILYSLLHPKQLVSKIENNGLFKGDIDEIKKIISPLQNELHTLEKINKLLNGILDTEQQKWISDYWFKGSMAMIVYERIRCDAVHDLWTTQLSFGNTLVDNNPVPDIDYKLLKNGLDKIVSFLKKTSLEKRKLFLNHNDIPE